MNNCIFCKIIRQETPADIIYEDDYVIAFHDIKKASPIHFLVIPKIHIESIDEIVDKNIKEKSRPDLEKIDITHDKLFYVNCTIKTCASVAKTLKIDKDGYRIVNNCGKNGLQTVKHLHFHVLGGRQLTWPPG